MEQEKIWDAFQNDESLLGLGFPARKRFEFLAKKIPSGSTVLNIGVGKGYLESLLTDKGITVSCLDPSSTAIDQIRSNLNLDERAQVGYSQDIPFPNAVFDYVVMSEVLEHLEDDVIKQTLKEVKRVLKKTGQFLGTVPADENLGASITVCPNCSEHFHRWGHVQSFSQDRLLNILKDTYGNANVHRVLLSDFKQLNWKGRVVEVLKQVQAFMNQKGSNQNFFFVAENR